MHPHETFIVCQADFKGAFLNLAEQKLNIYMVIIHDTYELSYKCAQKRFSVFSAYVNVPHQIFKIGRLKN